MNYVSNLSVFKRGDIKFLNDCDGILLIGLERFFLSMKNRILTKEANYYKSEMFIENLDKSTVFRKVPNR